MKITDFNPIGCFVVADDEVWQIVGFFDCALYESVEYFCERTDPETGIVERTSVFEDYEEMLVMYPSRDKAEQSREDLRIGRMRSHIEHLIHSLDDELEVMY